MNRIHRDDRASCTDVGNDDIILVLHPVDIEKQPPLPSNTQTEVEVTLATLPVAKRPLLSRLRKSISRTTSFHKSFNPEYSRSGDSLRPEPRRATTCSSFREDVSARLAGARNSRRKWWRALAKGSSNMVSLQDSDSGFYLNSRNRRAPLENDLDVTRSIEVDVLPLPLDANTDHHVTDRNGKPLGYFKNPWLSWKSAAWTDIYSAFTRGAVLKSPPRPGEEETFEENGRLVKVLEPDWKGTERRMQNTELGLPVVPGARVCWLGHAGVMVQIPRKKLDGGKAKTDVELLQEAEDDDEMVGVIFDPIFSKRCSPSQWAGPARYLDPPCNLEDLPPIQICCISHDHYDHLDYDTIMSLWRINEERIHFFVPLGLKAWFLSCGIPESQIHELDWHQESLITLSSEHTSHRKYKDDPLGYPPSRSRKRRSASMPGEFLIGSDEEDLIGTPDEGSSPYGGDSGSSSQERITLLNSSVSRTGRGDVSPTPRYAPVTLKVVCTPAQHRSGRGVLDQMKTLWASWVVGIVDDEAEGLPREQGFREQDGFKVFFGGDTGYRYAGAEEKDRDRFICPAFKDIARRYGPMDLCLLPISTGSSLSFLRNLIGLSLHHYSLTSSQHSNSWDAIQIARLMQARRTIAIHHSTFSPEDESRGCVYEFANIARVEGVSQDWDEEGSFVVADIGEVLELY